VLWPQRVWGGAGAGVGWNAGGVLWGRIVYWGRRLGGTGRGAKRVGLGNRALADGASISPVGVRKRFQRKVAGGFGNRRSDCSCAVLLGVARGDCGLCCGLR